MNLKSHFQMLLGITLFTSTIYANAVTPTYSISILEGFTPLGSIGAASVRGLNNIGQVTGDMYTSSMGAYITGPNGINISDIGSLAGYTTFANGINNFGQVVGESTITPQINLFSSPAIRHAYITGHNGVGIRDIGTLGGPTSIGYSINDSGVVVGVSALQDNIANHAFITNIDGDGIRSIGTLGGVNSWAYGVNNIGQVVGWSEISNGQTHGFLTLGNGESMFDLGTLGGSSSYARDVNNFGFVVGSASNFQEELVAFITAENGANISSLGTLGGVGSEAWGINSFNQVVGWSLLADNQTSHAFVTDNLGQMIDLNSLVSIDSGAYLRYAYDINDKGQIVAMGSDNLAYLLTVSSAVSEPSTTAMLGLGLLGLFGYSRRNSVTFNCL